MKAFKQSPLSRQVVQEYEDEEVDEMEESVSLGDEESEEESGDESDSIDMEEDEESLMSDEYEDQDDVIEIEDAPPKNSINASMTTVERMQLARNVQTMKASLFPADSVPDTTSSTPGAKNSPSSNNFAKKVVLPHKPVSFSFKQHDDEEPLAKETSGKRAGADDDATVPAAVSRTEFSSLPVVSVGSPQKYSRQERLQVSKVDLTRAVPYENSIAYGKHKTGALDAAFYMGRSFRAGFGPFGTYTCLKSMTHLSIKKVGDSKEV